MNHDSKNLRRRNATASQETLVERLRDRSSEKNARREDIVWGKSPDGEMFPVPTTHDVLTALFHPSYPKSHLDMLNLGLLALQLLIFFYLPRHTARWFFLVYFTFWRTAYDAGLGWLLTKQSKRGWIVKEVKRLGWLDERRQPGIRNWIRDQLAGKMGKDYSFDSLPLEYNTWLLFRQAVDVILLNDFLSYCMFAFSCFRVPEGLSFFVHIMRWIGGFALIGFNLWVKTEAHNVVKDYGWYWGDCFFQRGALVFDGVFELAPHPMYSVGYAGYYGLSLISGSYPVLFVSLAAHAAQFGFLVFFENPHIERKYGQRRPIAQRTLVIHKRGGSGEVSSQLSRSASESDVLSSPTVTSGETDLETETEWCDCGRRTRAPSPVPFSAGSSRGGASMSSVRLSQHDLLNKYFRRDTVLLWKVDIWRANDFMLLLIMSYSLAFAALPPLSHRAALALHFVHALSWTIFHTFGLGLVLRAQSEKKFLVRHFLNNYYYPENDDGSGAVQEAFTNWKYLYNLSMCMTYVSCIGLVWKTYSIPHDWTVGNELLRHTLGALLVGLHVWANMESFEVLGVFGWFFGDFFMEDFPAHLEYSGIYRYLNNPEVISGAAFFGLSLVSGSALVVALSVIRHLSYWWFLSTVENPHMRKLYGDSLRKEAGFVKVIKNVATKNARILESRAGKHAPKIRRVAKEVSGTFSKVYEEADRAMEEFFAKSRPKLSEVVEDTKVLLQQSRERFVITIANDISSYDRTNYRISIVADQTGSLRKFHLGQPITIHWRAPNHHSRRDWIGIYRVGANKTHLVTKTSSLGMWVPVHDEEWDGDFPLALERPPTPEQDCDGHVVFKGDALPWQVGQYEFRYHHDGKYNVMSWDGPMEVYVDRPITLDFTSVRQCLMHIVTLCLDSDPSLVPLCSKISEPGNKVANGDYPEMESRDPDDFRFWSERQAKRICRAIKQAFDVDYAPEVVVAHANLSALAHRILLSKKL